MFGTSIHWTTFFYLLLDIIIVVIASFHAACQRRISLKRYIVLGLLFITYNITGGFLPIQHRLFPIFTQYLITYGVSISLCIYIAYYLYKEYDITILQAHFSIENIIVLMLLCFTALFVIPFLVTNSIGIARMFFTIPILVIALYFCWAFKKHLDKFPCTNHFTLRRNRLSLFCALSIALLPVFTLVGDYQWLTFTVMNLSFYFITTMEIDRYLYFLENKTRMYEVFTFYKANRDKLESSKLIYQSLTRREIEIALSILTKKSYKSIGNDFYITERTVSKHASNIFKKTGVKNKTEFLSRFGKKRD